LADNNINQYIKDLAEEVKVEKNEIKEIIINSFRSLNINNDLFFDFDNESFSVYKKYKIIDEEKEINQEKEIIRKNIKDKKMIRGEFFFSNIDLKNLSFSIISEIKKHLRENIKKINKEKIQEWFKKFENKIVSGKIRNIKENYALIEIDDIIAYWEKKEWHQNQIQFGKRLVFLVKQLTKDEKENFRIILSRSEDLFIKKILTEEITELNNNDIIIKDLLRISGLLTKVIVESRRKEIDPLGACIGKNAERIRKISSLIYPERLDIAVWSEDKKILLFNLMSPVKIISLIKKKENWDVIVSQKQVSLILSNRGELVKKIGEYLEKKIHIKIFEELDKEKNSIIIWNGNINFENFNSFNK